ncbi:MAG: DUF5063 domain-containing protein [Bacteroidales bacterium]
MDNGKDGLVYSGPVIEFVAVANEVCIFMEQAGGFPKKDFVDKTRKILPLLYYKAGLLPVTEPFYQEGTEKFVSEEDWQIIHDNVLGRMGSHNDYAEILDPVYRDTEDNVGGSIAEDMADIYQDLKDFLLIYRMGTVELMNDAIWECVQHFEQYWGQKLLNSLRYLHSLNFGNEDLSDEDQEREGKEEMDDTGDWIISQRQKLWNEDED